MRLVFLALVFSGCTLVLTPDVDRMNRLDARVEALEKSKADGIWVSNALKALQQEIKDGKKP